jgi:hypothetical protein
VALPHFLSKLTPGCPLGTTHPEPRLITAPAPRRAWTGAQQAALDNSVASLLTLPDFAGVPRNQVQDYVTQRTTPPHLQVGPANQGAFPSELDGTTLGFYTDCGGIDDIWPT